MNTNKQKLSYDPMDKGRDKRNFVLLKETLNPLIKFLSEVLESVTKKHSIYLKLSLPFFCFVSRALRVRKKMSGERMPVKMIGDILTAQLPHMQPYIRFCSCQLNGAALIQQKTDEVPEFKEFVKVRKHEHSWFLSDAPVVISNL